MQPANTITVETVIRAPLIKVWNYFTQPEHITKWNNASPDWHTPHAENDLKMGGSFNFRMEAKDGSAGFDFHGIYTEVIPEEKISYALDDARTVRVQFIQQVEDVRVVETFEPEGENPLEMQRAGWQAILDNFKRYVETV